MKKKPLLYSENKSMLPYPSEVGSVEIVQINVDGWKKSKIVKVHKLFEKRKEEIGNAIKEFIESYNWNKIIYEADYAFEPIIGENYFLYEGDENFYLSLLSPKELQGSRVVKNKGNFIGKFKMNSENEWELQDE